MPTGTRRSCLCFLTSRVGGLLFPRPVVRRLIPTAWLGGSSLLCPFRRRCDARPAMTTGSYHCPESPTILPAPTPRVKAGIHCPLAAKLRLRLALQPVPVHCSVPPLDRRGPSELRLLGPVILPSSPLLPPPSRPPRLRARSSRARRSRSNAPHPTGARCAPQPPGSPDSSDRRSACSCDSLRNADSLSVCAPRYHLPG